VKAADRAALLFSLASMLETASMISERMSYQEVEAHHAALLAALQVMEEEKRRRGMTAARP